MRKFTCIILSFVLCTCVFSISSTESAAVNVSELSDDALLALYSIVVDEINSRKLTFGKSYNLPEGKYIIGQDIEPGRYTITCTRTSGEEIGNAYSSLGGLFSSLDDDNSGYGDLFGSLGGMMGNLVNAQVKIIGDYGTIIKSFELKTDQSVEITLEEKTALEIEDGSCELVPIS